ncbi:MAG: hypothetical protein GY768_08795 [Planctomycetaceae bacterium]|nr:hypothetical protein [Planctomycetaceae bacterium]
MNSPHQKEKDSTFRNLLPLVLAFLLGGAVLAALSALTMGFVGVIVAVVFGMAAFIAVQYLIWGWWLGDVIRQDDATREISEEGETESSRK